MIRNFFICYGTFSISVICGIDPDFRPSELKKAPSFTSTSKNILCSNLLLSVTWWPWPLTYKQHYQFQVPRETFWQTFYNLWYLNYEPITYGWRICWFCDNHLSTVQDHYVVSSGHQIHTTFKDCTVIHLLVTAHFVCYHYMILWPWSLTFWLQN